MTGLHQRKSSNDTFGSAKPSQGFAFAKSLNDGLGILPKALK